MRAVPTTGLASLLPMVAARTTGKKVTGKGAAVSLPEAAAKGAAKAASRPGQPIIRPPSGEPIGKQTAAFPGIAIKAKAAKAAKGAKARVTPVPVRRRVGLFRKLLADKSAAGRGQSTEKQPLPIELHTLAQPAPLPGPARQIAGATLVNPKAAAAAGGKASRLPAEPQVAALPGGQAAPLRSRAGFAAVTAGTQTGTQKTIEAVAEGAKDSAGATGGRQDHAEPKTSAKQAKEAVVAGAKPISLKGKPAQGNPAGQAVPQELPKGQDVQLRSQVAAGAYRGNGQAPAQAKTTPRPAGTPVPPDGAPARPAGTPTRRPGLQRAAASAGNVRQAAQAASAGQAKTASRTAGADRSFGKVLAESSGQLGADVGATAHGDTARTAPQANQPAPAGASDSTPEPSLVSQIAESFQAGAIRAGRQIVIRLHPPELGQVRVALQAEGTQLRAVLEVNNSRTLAEIQREAPALIQRLADGGVQLRRLDVNLNEQGSNDGGDSPLRDSQSRPQEGTGQGPGQQSEDRPPPAEADTDQTDPTPEIVSELGDQTINLWI